MELLKNKTLLTEEILDTYFQKKIIHVEDFCQDEIVPFWMNRKENFQMARDDKDENAWQVYWGLCFTPNLIKRDLKYVEELTAIYFLLTGEDLRRSV